MRPVTVASAVPTRITAEVRAEIARGCAEEFGRVVDAGGECPGDADDEDVVSIEDVGVDVGDVVVGVGDPEG